MRKTLGELTEQCLDDIAEKQGKIWTEKQRAKFDEVVAEVKAYNPPSPWICERGNKSLDTSQDTIYLPNMNDKYRANGRFK